MKQSVNVYQFRETFKRMDRQEQFSYAGQTILFNYLEGLADDIGEEYDLDVIALCCEYAESSADDIAKQYSIDLEHGTSDEDVQAAVEQYLREHTTLCGTTNTGDIVYQQF